METDEFGRARQDDQRPPPRSEARAMRRAAREARLAARRAAASATEDDGSYTDDELDPSTSADLSSALAELRTSLTDLFSDVKAANFRDPNLGIRKRFEEWRESYRGEYESAFGGLALVGVWEFWGRVEGVGAEVSGCGRESEQEADLELSHRSTTKNDPTDRTRVSRRITGINHSPPTATLHPSPFVPPPLRSTRMPQRTRTTTTSRPT